MLKRLKSVLTTYADSVSDTSDLLDLLHSLPFPIDWSNPMVSNILDGLKSPAIRSLLAQYIEERLRRYGTLLLFI